MTYALYGSHKKQLTSSLHETLRFLQSVEVQYYSSRTVLSRYHYYHFADLTKLNIWGFFCHFADGNTAHSQEDEESWSKYDYFVYLSLV